jgi:hypothetical protein
MRRRAEYERTAKRRPPSGNRVRVVVVEKQRVGGAISERQITCGSAGLTSEELKRSGSGDQFPRRVSLDGTGNVLCDLCREGGCTVRAMALYAGIHESVLARKDVLCPLKRQTPRT